MKKMFVFDVDGTLIDAYDAIRESLNATRREFGYREVSLTRVKRSVGRGDVLFIKEFFKEPDRKKALAFYRLHHKRSVLSLSRPIAGVRRVLYSLKRRKKITAVASNRPTAFTNLLLKKNGLRQYLDYVICADKLKRLKPDPAIVLRAIGRFKVSRREAVFIGDMDIDLETARRAGVDGVFVKGGSTPLGVIRKKFPRATIISSLKEVMGLYA